MSKLRRAENLGDLFLEHTVLKWDAGISEEDGNLERYRGIVRLWTSDGEPELDAKGQQRTLCTPETKAEGALSFMRQVTTFRPRPYQERMIRAMWAKRRVSRRAPRKSGKTACIANIVLHFAAVHDVCKVITTAGAWAQLEEFLWPEIHLWAGKADWTIIGRKPRMNLLDLTFGTTDYESKPSSRAFAIRSDEPDKIEGGHSENILVIFDEAKAIEDEMFDRVEGTLAGANTYAINASTPGKPIGRFYQIQTKRPGYRDWDAEHWTLEELTDALEGEARTAYIQWAEDRKAQWGENSALYRNHVLGEFADVSDEQIIPLPWVEAAQDRWRAWRDAGFPEEMLKDKEIRAQGVDAAGQGKDRMAQALRRGNAIREIKFYPRTELTDAVNAVLGQAKDYPEVNIEADAMGAPIIDRCREILGEEEASYPGVVLNPIISGGKTLETDQSGEIHFRNQRAFLWWHMREMLDPANGKDVMLPPDEEVPPDISLSNELTLPVWTDLRNQGIITVEAKSEIRKRLKGRSTDAADSVIFAFADDTTPYVSERVVVPVTASVSETSPAQSFYAVDDDARPWPKDLWVGRRMFR